jgi:hypothetical protein
MVGESWDHHALRKASGRATRPRSCTKDFRVRGGDRRRTGKSVLRVRQYSLPQFKQIRPYAIWK